MYKCENPGCNTVTQSGQPENKFVVDWRETSYTNPSYRRGKPTKEVNVTTGRERVKEIKLCPECYKILTGMEPARKAEPVKAPGEKTKRSFRDDRPPRKKRKWRNPKSKDKETKEKKEVVVERINPLKVVKG